MLFNRRISFLIFHRMRSYPTGIIWGENIALWIWYRNMRMRQSFTELHSRNADSERKHFHTKFISYREIILFSSVLNFRLSKSRILASSSAKSKVWTGNRLRLNPGRLHGLQSYPGPKELRCANSDQCCVSVSRYPSRSFAEESNPAANHIGWLSAFPCPLLYPKHYPWLPLVVGQFWHHRYPLTIPTPPTLSSSLWIFWRYGISSTQGPHQVAKILIQVRSFWAKMSLEILPLYTVLLSKLIVFLLFLRSWRSSLQPALHRGIFCYSGLCAAYGKRTQKRQHHTQRKNGFLFMFNPSLLMPAWYKKDD